jgi:membrane protease YdiL (CAAX protease family)
MAELPDAANLTTERQPPRPWGPWATAGWAVALAVVYALVQLVVAVPFLVCWAIADPGISLQAHAENLAKDGLFFAVATIVSDGVLIGLLVGIVWLRKWPARDYLALGPIGRGEALRYGAIMLGLVALTDTLTWLLGRPVVSDFQVQLYSTASSFLLLFLVLLLVAPVFEELAFRGFLFQGLASSRLGAAGTILLTSGIWAVVHFQYDWFGVVTIFVYGLFLGEVRRRTGSTTTTVFLHGILNVIATAETVVFMEFLR